MENGYRDINKVIYDSKCLRVQLQMGYLYLYTIYLFINIQSNYFIAKKWLIYKTSSWDMCILKKSILNFNEI